MNNQKIAKLLDQAADLLDRDGWQRRRTGPLNDTQQAPRCVSGAIYAVSIIDKESVNVEHALRDTLGVSITRWNDSIVKSKEEVIEVLRRTANKLRESS